MENPFVKLFAIDFKDHLEVKKSGNTELKYVSWAYAWAEVKKLYPAASYEVKKFNGLRIVIPFRGGIGVRHSFHGFIRAIQHRQPHFMRNALNRDRSIHHEPGYRVINIGQTVEFLDLIAGSGIQLLHLCPSSLHVRCE